MRMSPSCIGCLIHQSERLVLSMELDEDRKIEIMRQVCAIISGMDPELPPPHYGREVHSCIKRVSGTNDPYAREKRQSNKLALSMIDEVKTFISQSDDMLMTALKAAISGNIIDYGAPGSGNPEDVRSSLLDALAAQIPRSTFDDFRRDTQAASRILIVGDNAGEIVLDRLLVEQLDPQRVTYAVRGAPIINDATREDAMQSGISEMVTIIDSGDDTPGVDLFRASQSFISAWAEADVVILKGQGNFETVYGERIPQPAGRNRRLYFLFKVKCEPVSRMTGLPLSSIAFLAGP